jgi:HK97 family phage major capsid protein
MSHMGLAERSPQATPSDKLIKLVHSVKLRYHINAHWTMNSNTLELVRVFKNTAGDYIWKQGLETGQPSTLFGLSRTRRREHA